MLDAHSMLARTICTACDYASEIVTIWQWRCLEIQLMSPITCKWRYCEIMWSPFDISFISTFPMKNRCHSTFRCTMMYFWLLCFLCGSVLYNWTTQLFRFQFTIQTKNSNKLFPTEECISKQEQQISVAIKSYSLLDWFKFLLNGKH